MIYFQPSTGEFFGGETSLKVEASCNTKTLEGASCASELKERGVSKKSVNKVGSITYQIILREHVINFPLVVIKL